MRQITVVNVHGHVFPVFQRHRSYWNNALNGGSMLVICPEDNPVPLESAILTGLSGHHGREAWLRCQRIIAELDAADWDWCVMQEYDSICLDARLPAHPGFYGNVWLNKEAPKFMALRYANPPWTFDRMTFNSMSSIAKRYPSVYEDGQADRYWSALAMLAGVPILDYEPKGFSRATIVPGDMVELRKIIHEGAYAIHGIKEAWVLKEVERFKEEATTLHA